MQPARLIALYLPQFHPIPENDEWWGKGFTEWTNVAKARVLFPGHYQPRLPADLGFYDLRVPEVRAAQADLARKAGIEGFCYWHYWFAGRRLLERPFNEVLASGEPDFPFCLAWANASWRGTWYGAARNRLLIEQTYPGEADHEQHFYSLLAAFHDPRYIRVNGKPLFKIFQPVELPEPEKFIGLWQRLAQSNGLPGIHFVAHLFRDQDYAWREAGYDAGLIVDSLKVARQRVRSILLDRMGWTGRKNGPVSWRERLGHVPALGRLCAHRVLRHASGWPQAVYYYEDAIDYFSPARHPVPDDVYPSVLPNWDNTARSGHQGVILHDSTPALFRRNLDEVLAAVANRPAEERLVFIKSWNEWAEGNYLEPDQKFGHGYLDAVRSALDAMASAPTDPIPSHR